LRIGDPIDDDRRFPLVWSRAPAGSPTACD
jgi:hypothetical protein